MTESLEPRAEELVKRLRELAGHYRFYSGSSLVAAALDAAQVIEQLLSENRQVRVRVREIESGPAWKMAAKEQAKLVASLRQDLDRISAEREAYLDFVHDVAAWDDAPDVLEARARRILAENDR